MLARMTQSGRAASTTVARGAALALALAVSSLALPAQAAGTWTQMTSTPSGGPAFGLWLLTDGRVLSHASALNTWAILTPDKTGSYVNGTWKTVASSTHARGGAQQHILKDGRFFQAGGEYIDGPACTTALCPTAEAYDPVANTWTNLATAPYDIGDTGSTMLADGRVLDSTRAGSQIQIYDPTTNTWSMGAAMPLGSGDENAWASLQNGNVLAVGYAKAGAAIYNPSTNKWTKTTVPSGFDTGDTGGISQMFDGRVFVYGLAGHSYIYTPGATAADAGTWANGPTMLNGDEAEDEYSDTLPNGMVWGALVTVTYGPGVILQQFDPTTNTVSSVTTETGQSNPYPIDYLNLPNGQVMITPETGTRNWVYTPDTQPQDAWRPTVTSVVFNSAAGNYTLTGTQISGLINGADEGDDMTMGENYPIVWLTDSANNVYYCRSFNFSNMMPSNGSAPETAQFTTPAGLPSGSYNLFVSAVGVQSKTAFPFTTGSSTTGTGGASGAGTGGVGGSSGGLGGVAGSTGTAGSGGLGAGGTRGAAGSGGGIAGASGAAGTSGGATGLGGSNAGSGGTVGTGGAPGASGSAGTSAAGGTSAGSAGTSGAAGTRGGGAGANGTGGTGVSGGGTDGAGSSGCSCATAGPTSPGSLAGMLLLLGAALAVSRRRHPRTRRSAVDRAT